MLETRQCGVMSDVAYRNAMMTVSANGWRRRGPGPMPSLKRASLLPRAVELSIRKGSTCKLSLGTYKLPGALLDLVTARARGLPNGMPLRVAVEMLVTPADSWGARRVAACGRCWLHSFNQVSSVRRGRRRGLGAGDGSQLLIAGPSSTPPSGRRHYRSAPACSPRVAR